VQRWDISVPTQWKQESDEGEWVTYADHADALRRSEWWKLDGIPVAEWDEMSYDAGYEAGQRAAAAEHERQVRK